MLECEEGQAGAAENDGDRLRLRNCLSLLANGAMINQRAPIILLHVQFR